MKFKTPAVAVAAFIAGAVAIPSVVGAQAGDTPAEETAPTEIFQAHQTSGVFYLDTDDVEFPGLDVSVLGDFEPSAEDVAKWNAETDKLIEQLRAAGVEVAVETDEFGVRYPDFFENMSEADWEKVDGVFVSSFGKFEGPAVDFEKFEPTAEELAEWNAETEAFMAELEAAGIPVTQGDEDGFTIFDLPEELTAEQEAALEGFFGDCVEVEGDNHEGDDNDGDANDSEGEVEPSVLDA